MKILQVIHDFLPKHQAGSELYCYHLSRELQRQGHEVRLFFTEIDHARPPYSVREGIFDGISFLEVVNNHSYSSFHQTYANPVIEKIFAAYLDEYRPDVAHFHHLLGLSFGCARVCRTKGIPVVFTLHDYWLTCPRGGGQRFRGEGKVCHDVDTSLCAECISRYSFPLRAVQRMAKRILTSLETINPPSLLPLLQNGRIDVPDPTFVSRGVCTVDGESREALVAHPPCRITFRRDVPERAALLFAVAMDPSTYDQPGNGVRFRITCDGRPLYERVLHAKEQLLDRGWKVERVSLSDVAGRKREFVFETQAHPGDSVDFCAACWAEPNIVYPEAESYRPGFSSRLRTRLESALTRFQGSRLRRMVDRRAAAVRELFQWVDCFIAPSEFLRSKFVEYGVSPEKIVFSDYGIHVSRRYDNPRKPEHPIRFTYIGTLVEHKGLHVLLEAFNGLPKEAAVLNVYGDLTEFAGYVSRLRSMIAHPGIALRGRAENRDIPAILAQTDVLVVPSIWFENSPITIHEAFLAQVPVITSRFGGMADLVRDGINGSLFEVGNAGDLRRRLLRCVESPDFIRSQRPDPQSVKTIAADAEWMEQVYHSLIRNPE